MNGDLQQPAGDQKKVSIARVATFAILGFLVGAILDIVLAVGLPWYALPLLLAIGLGALGFAWKATVPAPLSMDDLTRNELIVWIAASLIANPFISGTVAYYMYGNKNKYPMKWRKVNFILLGAVAVYAIAFSALIMTAKPKAVDSARMKSRDFERIAEVKQIQTALELYFADQNAYPVEPASVVIGFENAKVLCAGDVAKGFKPEVGGAMGCGEGATSYLSILPSAPMPNDGECAATGTNGNQYLYTAPAPDSYTVTFCLGGTTDDLTAGPHAATPTGINGSNVIEKKPVTTSAPAPEEPKKIDTADWKKDEFGGMTFAYPNDFKRESEAEGANPSIVLWKPDKTTSIEIERRTAFSDCNRSDCAKQAFDLILQSEETSLFKANNNVTRTKIDGRDAVIEDSKPESDGTYIDRLMEARILNGNEIIDVTVWPAIGADLFYSFLDTIRFK